MQIKLSMHLPVLLYLFLDIGMVLLVGITLAIQNGTLFLLTLASLPFYVVAILAFVKSYEKANQEEMAAGATLNSSIIESLKGIETIKAYSGEEKVYDRVDREFIKLMKILSDGYLRQRTTRN